MIWIILAFGANFISSWIRIRVWNADPDTNLMRTHADPDPKHCPSQNEYENIYSSRTLFGVYFCLFYIFFTIIFRFSSIFPVSVIFLHFPPFLFPFSTFSSPAHSERIYFQYIHPCYMKMFDLSYLNPLKTFLSRLSISFTPLFLFSPVIPVVFSLPPRPLFPVLRQYPTL